MSVYIRICKIHMKIHTHLHTYYHTAFDACEYAIRFVRKYLCECVQVKIFMCVYADITFNPYAPMLQCSMLTYTHIHTCMHRIQPVGSPTARADVLYVAYMLCVLCSSVW